MSGIAAPCTHHSPPPRPLPPSGCGRACPADRPRAPHPIRVRRPATPNRDAEPNQEPPMSPALDPHGTCPRRAMLSRRVRTRPQSCTSSAAAAWPMPRVSAPRSALMAAMPDTRVVVVSAMQGVTDALIALLGRAHQRLGTGLGGAAPRHLAAAEALGGERGGCTPRSLRSSTRLRDNSRPLAADTAAGRRRSQPRCRAWARSGRRG